MIDIIIPTLKKFEEIEPMIMEIKQTVKSKCNIIPTCTPGSASFNRNLGFNNSNADIKIMMDDDITGMVEGWADKLIEPLILNDEIIMISARLINRDGSYSNMIDFQDKISNDTKLAIVEKQHTSGYPALPGSCIAFRKRDADIVCKKLNRNKPFDENYKRACYEDTDFCMALNYCFPEGKFVVNNGVKIIHLNEEKWRVDETWKENQKYFYEKWRKYGYFQN